MQVNSFNKTSYFYPLLFIFGFIAVCCYKIFDNQPSANSEP